MKKMILIGVAVAIIVAIVAYAIMFFVTINRLKKPVLYEVEGMGSTIVKKDIVYGMVGKKELKMDLYLPPDEGGRFPVIVLLQGNGPEFLMKNAKDWTMFGSYGRILGASGIATVVFNRREHMNYKNIEQPVEDIHRLLAHLRENAEAYQLDMDRVGMWAFSAGGAYLSIPLSSPDDFKCLISYYGVLDLDLLKDSLSKSLPEETRQTYSPRHQLDSSDANLKIFVATAARDRVKKIPASNHLFVARAKELGIDVRQVIHGKGHHGFDVLDDDDRTREIIGETIDFIQRYL